MSQVRLVAATGMLGSGYREASLARAMELGVDMVGCDAGSTDAGPSALATARPQFSRAAVARDTRLMLKHAREHGVPMIIGSAGTAGGDPHLAWQAEIVEEAARELDLHFRLALIRAEQAPARVLALRDADRIRPLPPAHPLSVDDVSSAVRIVAMMGPEPIQAALQEGADVIVAGRCSDSAIYAAIPLMRGLDPAIAWHAGKTLECGAAPVISRSAPDSLMGILDEESFTVFPLREDYACSPQSVASHSLYENADPYRIAEPGGTVVTTRAVYKRVSDRAVAVSGAEFEAAAEYTVKLEGARLAGFSTIVLGGIRDPYILRELDAWLERLGENLRIRLESIVPASEPYQIVTRVYGRDAVMGEHEPRDLGDGHEVGILWEVLSESQELSHSIASSLAHMAVHNPTGKWKGLISGVAFPFAPMEVDRGAVYEFHLNHVAVLDDPCELFTTEFVDV